MKKTKNKNRDAQKKRTTSVLIGRCTANDVAAAVHRRRGWAEREPEPERERCQAVAAGLAGRPWLMMRGCSRRRRGGRGCWCWDQWGSDASRDSR